MADKTEVLKKVIKDNFMPLGLFFTRNTNGDIMETVYEDERVQVDVCPMYEYIEIFGVTAEERIALEDYYEAIGNEWIMGRA